jgi:hypothetical protein
MKHLFLLLTLAFMVKPCLFASDIISVKPIDKNMLVVHFDDGYMRLHGYHETGVHDTAFQVPLDVKKATETISYQLFSENDMVFSSGKSPIRIGRKSKPTEFSFNGGFGFPVILEHWIYLEFSQPLTENMTYTLKLTGLAKNRDEISFTFDPKQMLSPAIHVNQLGFTPESNRKFAYISHWIGDLGGFENESLEGQAFHIVQCNNNKTVFSGQVKRYNDFQTATPDVPLDQSYKGSMSGADIWECDFSGLKKPGEYNVVVEGMGCSYAFEIDPDIYRDAFYFACRGLYHQRSGIERTAKHTKYTRPADHHPKLTPEYAGAKTKHQVYLTSVRNIDLTDESGFNQKENILRNIIDTLDNCWGFYHDAGDWDGYSSHIRVPRELMLAYELAPANFRDNELNIPESGNSIPDILDEAVWLIDYFKRNVGKTGGIFGGRIHTEFYKGFPGIGMGIPSYEDPGFSMVTGEDPQLSYEFSSIANQYAWCLKQTNARKYAEIISNFEKAAVSAYEWAQNNTRPGDEKHVMVAKANADVWFYKLTGKKEFQEQFVKTISEQVKDIHPINEYSWAYCLYAYGLIPEDFQGIDKTAWKNVRLLLVEYAQDKVTNAIDARRAFRAGGNPKAAALQGSATIPYGMPALIAWKITGDKKYYEAAQTSSDYALGGNPLNILWLTGLGDNPPKQIMNLDSYYDGIDDPIPGIAPYGPSHRCDWMSQPNDNCKGAGPWDNDYALDNVYPASDQWPVHEFWFEGLYCPPAGEYTVHQTVSTSTAVYGVLCQANGERKPNIEPKALAMVKTDLDKKQYKVQVKATDKDGYISRVEFYTNHRLAAVVYKAPWNFQSILVSCQYTIVGYSRFSLILASVLVNCQFIVAFLLFR